MNDRMQAYLNGELSLEEARELEAELARQGAEMDPAVIEDKSVGDAWRALDARERVPKRSARRVPVAVWFALAAGLALAIWFAWPRPEPVQVADPKLPPVVIPVHQVADQEVVEGNDVVQVATPEVQVAVTDVEVVPEMAGRPDDVRVVAGQPLLLDLRETSLGVGVEERRRNPRKALPGTVAETLRVEPHPQMEAIVASGLLDGIVRCVDEGDARPGNFTVTVHDVKEKRARHVEISGGSAERQRCMEAIAVYRYETNLDLWRHASGTGSSTPFEVTLASTNAKPDPQPKKSPGKMPIRENAPTKGKQPWKEGKGNPYDAEPTKGGKDNPYDSD